MNSLDERVATLERAVQDILAEYEHFWGLIESAGQGLVLLAVFGSCYAWNAPVSAARSFVVLLGVFVAGGVAWSWGRSRRDAVATCRRQLP